MKTVEEWNAAFDLLWNNISSDQAPGLEKYEKSVFLTQAENALVRDYFSANSNVWKEGFDDSRRRQSDFRILIRSKKLEELYVGSNADDYNETSPFRLRKGTRYFAFPSDYIAVINEEVSIEVSDKCSYYAVMPISHDEYTRLMLRPYKYPPKGMLWRIITEVADVPVYTEEEGSGELSEQEPVVELIGKFGDNDQVTYNILYVSRPSPIILETITDDDLSIDGKKDAMPCALPEHLHDEILARAVQIAKIAWIDNPGETSR